MMLKIIFHHGKFYIFIFPNLFKIAVMRAEQKFWRVLFSLYFNDRTNIFPGCTSAMITGTIIRNVTFHRLILEPGKCLNQAVSD